MTDILLPRPGLPRRGFLAAAAAAWALPSAPAEAAAPSYVSETSLWSGSVLLDQEGRSFVLRDVQRPLALLKLWASWCPVCAGEMSQLAAGAAAMARDVDVILISHPQYWEADLAMARRRKLPFRLATFAASNSGATVRDALLDGAGQYVVPKSLVFRSRDRAIVSDGMGARDWSSAAALGQMRAWLG